MVIRYCDKCGVRVRQSDIDAETVKLLDETRALCPSCCGPVSRRSSGQNVIRPRPARETGGRTAPPARRDSGRRPASAGTQSVSTQYRSTGSSSKPLLIIGGVVGAIILLAILSLIAGVGDKPPARAETSDAPRPPETTKTAQPAATKPEIPGGPAVTPATGKTDTTVSTKDKTDYDPRAGVADSLLAGAKDYLQKNPEDPWGYKERLEALCQGYARTPAAEEATRLLAAWKEPPVDQSLAGLAACWTFDEGSGTTVGDASGQGHNGTLVNAPEWIAGRKGKALRFSGKQHVLIARSEDLKLGASDFTVAAWVKTTGGGAILCKTDPSGKWIRNGKSFFIGNTVPMMDSGWVGSVRGTTRVGDGQWHHMAIAFQHGTRKVSFFVDGRSAGEGRLQLASDPGGMAIKLGVGFPGNYSGDLDEVCIFRRSLPAGQIRMLMEKGVEGTPSDVAATTVTPPPPAIPTPSPPTKPETPPPAPEKPSEPAEPVHQPDPVVSTGPKAAPRCAVYEPFDYPPGKPLDGKSGTSDMGFEGPWKRGSEIVSKTMAWGGLPTAGHCVAATRNYDAYREIGKTTLSEAGLLDDGATLWLSFLMSVEEANLTNVDMNIAFANQPFTFYELNKYHQRMELEKSGSGIGVGYDCGKHSLQACVWVDGKRRPAEPSSRKLDAGPNALALVVAKITWGRDGEADAIEVYMPDRNLEPGPVFSKASADLDQKGFNLLGIQMKEPHTHVDEIRMGATYADVTSDTIAKMLHGLKVEEVAATVERDGFNLSLGIMRNLSERFDAGKVEVKKLAAVGDSIAASSYFDASVRKVLTPADGYAFAGQMGFASSSATVSSVLRSVPRELPRQKPEVVRICIGLSDMARNLPPGDLRADLRNLVDAVLDAGAIPVLHTIPVKTIAVPADKTKRESADRATQALYTVSETVAAFNAVITEVAAEKSVPLVDAWQVVNAGPDAHQKYFDARGALKREGFEAVNEPFMKLYRILERGIVGRGQAQ